MNSARNTAHLLFVMLRRTAKNKVVVRSKTLLWLSGRRILRTSFLLELNQILVDRHGWTLIELDNVKFSAIKINLLKCAKENNLQIKFNSVEKTAESINEIMEQTVLNRAVICTGIKADTNFTKNFQAAFFLELNELLINKYDLVLVEIERGKFCVTRWKLLYKAQTVDVGSYFSYSEIDSLAEQIRNDSSVWADYEDIRYATYGNLGWYARSNAF